MATISDPLAGPVGRSVVPPAMTRCECAEVAFEEVARRAELERISLREACRRTGCGSLCSACQPDLESFLASCRPGPALG